MKTLLIAALLLGACAHMPSPAKAPDPVAAKVVPCLTAAPPALVKHPLMFLIKPEDVDVVNPDGEKMVITTFHILKPSVIDFFVTAKDLSDWADAAYAACGK